MKWLESLWTSQTTARLFGFGNSVKNWAIKYKLFILATIILSIIILYKWQRVKSAQVQALQQTAKQHRTQAEQAHQKATSAEKKLEDLSKTKQNDEAQFKRKGDFIDRMSGDNLQSAIDSAYNYR